MSIKLKKSIILWLVIWVLSVFAPSVSRANLASDLQADPATATNPSSDIAAGGACGIGGAGTCDAGTILCDTGKSHVSGGSAFCQNGLICCMADSAVGSACGPNNNGICEAGSWVCSTGKNRVVDFSGVGNCVSGAICCTDAVAGDEVIATQDNNNVGIENNTINQQITNLQGGGATAQSGNIMNGNGGKLNNGKSSYGSVALSPNSTPEAGGLIPCGNGSDDPCTLCHFIIGFQGLVNFMLKLVTTVGFAGVFASGIIYVVSAGDSKMMETAKSALSASLIGFAIVMGAWLIVNVSIHILGANVGMTPGQNWYDFNCSTISSSGVALPPVAPVAIADGSYCGPAGSKAACVDGWFGDKCPGVDDASAYVTPDTCSKSATDSSYCCDYTVPEAACKPIGASCTTALECCGHESCLGGVCKMLQ